MASFLVAHLFYIALFRQGQGWFPSKRALMGLLAVGALMYSIIWGGLNDPVALSSLWILATYYCAQMLILHNVAKASVSRQG